MARNDDPVVLWLAGGAGVVKVAGAVLALALARHVLVWDLWFVVWGLLLGAAAWAGQSQVVSARG